MVDKATFLLADKGDKLAAAIKVQKAKIKAAADAETARAKVAREGIDKLTDELESLQSDFTKCGAARMTIQQAVPAEITQPLEQAEAEIRQHAAALETADRIHRAHIDAQKAALGAGVNTKEGPGKRLAEDHAKAVAGAKARLDAERDRVGALKAKVTKHEAARDAFLKELRTNANRANGKAQD